MVKTEVYANIVATLKARPTMTGDELAEHVQRIATSHPLLGHVILAQMVDDGQLELDEDDPSVRYKLTDATPAGQVPERT